MNKNGDQKMMAIVKKSHRDQEKVRSIKSYTNLLKVHLNQDHKKAPHIKIPKPSISPQHPLIYDRDRRFDVSISDRKLLISVLRLGAHPHQTTTTKGP